MRKMKNQEFLKEWLRYIDLDITDNVPDGEAYCVNGLHKEIWNRIKTNKQKFTGLPILAYTYCKYTPITFFIII